MLQFLLNNATLLIFLLPVLVSGLNWLSRKLKEQAELKRLQQERERLRLEALRTGRFDEAAALAARPTPQAAAAAAAEAAEQQRREQLAELAARRQRQLEELRRQRQAALQQAAQRQAGGVGTPPAVPGRVATPGHAGAAASPAAAADLQRRRAEAQARLRARQEELARQQRERQDRDQAESRRRAAAEQRRRDAESARLEAPVIARDVIESTEIGGGGLVAMPRPAQQGRVGGLPGFGSSLQRRVTPAELRRGIVLAEVLNPPVALRGDAAAP